MENITCVLCGSTEFYEEIGFYYCKECQTQSQDVRQHVIDGPENEVSVAAQILTSKRVKKKGKKKEQTKTEDLLTSWESYNYIILGLVHELVDLGADPQLKEVVKVLWFKYLNKLEVIGTTSDFIPKLSACYSTRDALIIYGRSKIKAKRKKRRARSTSSVTSDLTSIDSSFLASKRSKKRRELVLSQYKEDVDDEESLNNLSLNTLKSSTDVSLKNEEQYLRFAKTARKELLKKISKNRLKNHVRDTIGEFAGPNLNHRSLSTSYSRGPEVISRSKIISLIYLGLLVIRDKIQLGDLIRYIREGRLSFYSVKHFFPDDYRENVSNYEFWDQTHLIPTHLGLRKSAGELAKYLHIKRYLIIPDLISLCARYCRELNLPDEVATLCKSCIGRTLPRMHVSGQSQMIPNYEGRAMSLIIFIMKLVFGLDGVTENGFTAFAEKINKFNRGNRMFEWHQWAFYIQYRRAVLAQHHFPTQYLMDTFETPRIFTQFISEQRGDEESRSKIRVAEVLEDILKQMNRTEEMTESHIKFPVSLTPFRDYVETLLDSAIFEEKHYMEPILRLDFKNDSLKNVLFPYLFFRKNMNKLKIEHKGANADLRFIEVCTPASKKLKLQREAAKTIYIEVNESNCEKAYVPEEAEPPLRRRKEMKLYKARHLANFEKNMKRMQRYAENFISGKFKSIFKDEGQYVHYNSFGRYWLNSHDMGATTKDHLDTIFETFPYSFKLLLNECARTTEQSIKELYTEFNGVELRICYCTHFAGKKEEGILVVDPKLKRLIKGVENYW